MSYSYLNSFVKEKSILHWFARIKWKEADVGAGRNGMKESRKKKNGSWGGSWGKGAGRLMAGALGPEGRKAGSLGLGLGLGKRKPEPPEPWASQLAKPAKKRKRKRRTKRKRKKRKRDSNNAHFIRWVRDYVYYSAMRSFQSLHSLRSFIHYFSLLFFFLLLIMERKRLVRRKKNLARPGLWRLCRCARGIFLSFVAAPPEEGRVWGPDRKMAVKPEKVRIASIGGGVEINGKPALALRADALRARALFPDGSLGYFEAEKRANENYSRWISLVEDPFGCQQFIIPLMSVGFSLLAGPLKAFRIANLLGWRPVKDLFPLLPWVNARKIEPNLWICWIFLHY